MQISFSPHKHAHTLPPPHTSPQNMHLLCNEVDEGLPILDHKQRLGLLQACSGAAVGWGGVL